MSLSLEEASVARGKSGTMRAIDKIEKQLINELSAACQKVAELKAAEHNRQWVDYDLKERNKELECLCGIAIIVSEPSITLDKLYQKVVDLLPHGWRYPEITCARITIDNKKFTTKNYRETAWKLSSDIKVDGTNSGAIEVNYLEERAGIKESPFLKEERLLINVVARRLGRATEYRRMEEALQQSEEFSYNLLSNASNPVLVVNPDTSIRYVNPNLEKLTGFQSSELIGTGPPYPWWRIEALGKTAKSLRQSMCKGARSVEELFRKKDSEQFWVSVNAIPVTSNGKLEYYLSIWTDITEQRELRENLQFYVTELIKAQEEERKRIARDLHDETIQELSCLLNDVNEIIKGGKRLPKRNAQQLEQLQVKIDGIMNEVRRFSHELRPDMLDRFGLVPSLELLTEEMNLKEKTSCRMEVTGSKRRLSSEVELTLFRIVQEACHNIRRYAEATQAVVKIEFADEKVVLSISDNGSGFAVPKMLSSFARRGKLGVMGMKERTRLLNGSFKIESEACEGTTITVKIPTQADSQCNVII